MTKLNDRQRDLIQAKNFGFLATTNADGSPQVTPVWVDTDGEHLLVNTAVGRVKERNTQRDPRVAVSITEQTNPYRWIMIRGRVSTRIKGPTAEEHINKLAKKYTGAEKYTKRNLAERRIILKILPEHVTMSGS